MLMAVEGANITLLILPAGFTFIVTVAVLLSVLLSLTL